jgi:hypothetical protein
MFLLTMAALVFATLLVIVLPGAVLVMALLVNLRRSPEPEARLWLAADGTDPASKPCSPSTAPDMANATTPLEQAS